MPKSNPNHTEAYFLGDQEISEAQAQALVAAKTHTMQRNPATGDVTLQIINSDREVPRSDKGSGNVPNADKKKTSGKDGKGKSDSSSLFEGLVEMLVHL